MIQDASLPDMRHIDLWYVYTEAARGAALLDEYRFMLPQDEAEREKRFVFEKDRIQYLVTRALLRTALSSYTGSDPCDWVFGRNYYDKPFVAKPADTTLSFNLSNTLGLVVCAVTQSCDIGVDVENLDRAGEVLKLARRYFAPAEVSALKKRPEERQREAFYEFWTLKEAYIKAHGMGLSMPLDDFAFVLDENEPPKIRFAPGVRDRATDWQFAQFQLPPRYQIGLAVRASGGSELAVQLIETIPLRDPKRRVLPPEGRRSGQIP